MSKSMSELHYARYDDIRNLVSSDFLAKPEEDLIKEYDSRKTYPHPVFLGMDEGQKSGALTYKVYSGIPYFALDVTPLGSVEYQDKAKDVISRMEAQDLIFYKARIIATLPADQGMQFQHTQKTKQKQKKKRQESKEDIIPANQVSPSSGHLCTGSYPPRLEQS